MGSEGWFLKDKHQLNMMLTDIALNLYIGAQDSHSIRLF